MRTFYKVITLALAAIFALSACGTQPTAAPAAPVAQGFGSVRAR